MILLWRGAMAVSSGSGSSSSQLVCVISPALAASYAELSTRLTDADCAHELGGGDEPLAAEATVHWLAAAAAAPTRRLPQLAVVWTTQQLMRAAGDGTLLAALARAASAARDWCAGSALALIVVGKGAPGLDQVIGSAQLELGLSARRALNVKELAELLATYSAALSASERAPALEEEFLAGLTAHDVLHNKSCPKTLEQSWLGALKQILPESAALAVQAAHPSFRSLHARLAEAEAAGGEAEAEAALADLRVGSKRLGPARSRRVHRMLRARAEQGGEAF